MMGPYDPTEALSRLIEQLERGREFARAEGQQISDAMIMSKGITLLAQTGIFNDDIREWIRQLNIFFPPLSAPRAEKRDNNCRKMGVH